MSRKLLLGALPPQEYNFKNWDYFQSEAMRFHNATRPEECLVIDRVGTFRSLMAADVIEHLGSLVHLHPRFQTTEGWDEWLLSVTDALRIRDKTIRDPITADSWVDQFKKGKVSARRLWTGLDLLASKGEIDSEEQRQLFWDAHSWEKQGQLAERCPYFDPRDEVWDGDAEESKQKMAEQLLCRIMALSSVDSQLSSKRRWLIVAIVIALLFIIPGIVLSIAASVGRRSEDAEAILIICGVYSICIGLATLIPVGALWSQIRELLRQQRESLLHERV